ncbi:putative germin-like protein 2-1 [Cynara cardunculus var. scolymus]|uniref:putative germin-like protein 2-1 n=1 Tax=Cynara cardunculus var. scolymus TaxID=59895 RepID=UPI000D628889|nr:putative germin-like protein 2-1 [Cynara cardunculus var. scolymus]
MARVFTSFTLLALVFSMVMATDTSPLQDFCVADTSDHVFVNGFTCKNPSLVEANDFYFGGLHMKGNTSNPVGSRVTPVFVEQLPGLNTLGIAMARVDYEPWGLNPPHLHPRATEVLTVVKGTLEVGFVTSNPENRFISKVLHEGDVFVFPMKLVHYQRNIGNTNAFAISTLSNQNPGIVTIANVVFGSKPKISTDILVKTFQTSSDIISNLQSKF